MAMIILLAPSKTMIPYVFSQPTSQPIFLRDADKIVMTVRSTNDLAGVMHISSTLASEVADKYSRWTGKGTPAILTYRGDVYRWFYAETLDQAALQWAQQHVRIMSGLYGVVRPLDQVAPYRLEMKAKLPVGDTTTIYDFWGDRLARTIDGMSDEIICNLSSDEYARPVIRYTKKRVITPIFMDKKGDGAVTVPIYSKMMRGIMARWMIDHRIETSDALRQFSSQGYAYDASRSTADHPVFYRETSKPIRF